MLQFFRKYQKILFLFVTIMVVTSFLFFGTYQAIAPIWHRKAETSYVEQMARFLDTESWMESRKILSANFLNDGVVSKEFLETGLGALLAQAYPDRFKDDFAVSHAKEKKYVPYVHPTLPTLSAELLWPFFAPDVPVKLKALQTGNGGFNERNALFLTQKQFPPSFFAQVVRYQEYNTGAKPDSRLAKDDLPLFGYHTLSDWYGPQYVEAIAELVIRIAAESRKLGYKVSRSEMLAELVVRSQENFQGLQGKIALPVSDGYGWMQFYLRQIGMTEETALKIWEDVTLFRRLMHAIGDAALIDTLLMDQFYAFAYENATIELYQMPAECRLKSQADLEGLEAYLAAVGQKASAFDIPQDYLPLETIKAKAPELVGRRYTLEYAHTSKKALQAKVSVKETVDWECDPKNWQEIQQQFPGLTQKVGTPFDILEKMDAKNRKLIDTYTRKQIVNIHPEWIQEALLADEMQEKQLFLSYAPSQKTFEGIADSAQLMKIFEEKNEVIGYSQDAHHYYRFLMQDKNSHDEILTFKEASQSGILATLSEQFNAGGLAKEVTEACPSAVRQMPFAYRFAPFIATAASQPPVGDLARQFMFEKKEKTLSRCEKCFIPLDEVLKLKAGQCSSVQVDPLEGAYFYRFVEQREEKILPLEKLAQTQEMLSREVRCNYFAKLLENVPDPCSKKSSP
jgi:GcvH upstream region-like protein